MKLEKGIDIYILEGEPLFQRVRKYYFSSMVGNFRIGHLWIRTSEGITIETYTDDVYGKYRPKPGSYFSDTIFLKEDFSELIEEKSAVAKIRKH